MKRFRRIIHPSDFSTASRSAFALALDLAKRNRAALTLVHVMAPLVPLTGDGYVSPRVWQDVERTARAYAWKQLDKLIATARKSGSARRVCSGRAWRPMPSCVLRGADAPM